MPKQQVHCLLIGNEQHHEWRSVTEWLGRHVHLVTQETPTAAFDAFHTSHASPPFDLILLAQSRPGQFDSAEVESLYQRWPTAKMLGLFGTWCEGEGRTGRPWPGVWRVHAGNCIRVLRQLFDIEQPRSVQSSCKEPHTGIGSWQREELHAELIGDTASARTASRRSRSWLLPRSITDAERIYYDAAEPLVHCEGRILISAATAEAYTTLADAVGQSGFSSEWQPPEKGQSPEKERCPETDGDAVKAVGGILDMSRGTPEEWQSAHQFARRIAPAPLLLLLGFPRTADHKLAETLSAAVYGKGDQTAVLPKPYRLNDLCTEITRMTGITVTTRVLETLA
jgi:hypothetical protein